MFLRRLVAISFTVAVGASAFAGQSWDLAGDWSPPTNPNGAWSYGVLSGTTFTAATYSGNAYRVSGIAFLDQNTGLTSIGGVDPGQVSLLASLNGVPDARWTAPTSGHYDISVLIGGTQVAEGGVTGNKFADEAGLSIGGVAQTADSFTNNVSAWSLVNVYLTAGTSVDAFVGDPGISSGNNTQTKIHIAAVPEPAPFAALGLGALGLLSRRKRR